LSPATFRVYDAGIDGRCLWVAMELLEGKTLRAVLNSEHISLTRALDIAIAVAAGAKAAHELRLVHRDLKPENVFITTEGGVVVLDLGTAKLLGETDAKRTQRVMGTVAYISPEHLLGPGEGVDVDQRSDVYSLGIILYEMLAFHPFSRSRTSLELPDVAALAQHQLFTPPIPLPEIAPWVPTYVWQLVEKSIQKDREYRHDSMQEFEIEARQAQRWYVEEQQCARAERIPVTPREFAVSSAPPVERPKAPVTRDRLLIAAPLVGGVLALAVLSGIRGYKARNAPLERAFSSPGVALAGQRFAARVSIDPKRTGELLLVQPRSTSSPARPATFVPREKASKHGKSAEHDRPAQEPISKHRLPSSGL